MNIQETVIDNLRNLKADCNETVIDSVIYFIESQQKKIPKQLTIEELREQFEENIGINMYPNRFDKDNNYYDNNTNYLWAGYKRGASINNLIKEGKHE